MYEYGHNFATGLPIEVMFGSRVGFPAELRFFSARQHAERAMLSQIRPSVRLCVCLSVTRVDQSKTVEVRIMQFSPYSSPIPLVFELQVSSGNSDGIPPSGGPGGVQQWWVAALRETSYFHSSNAFARWLLKLDILSQLLQTYSPGGGTVAR